MRNKTVIFVITLLILFFLPYFLNPIILPGNNDVNANFFKGEWFNRVNNNLPILNRWAHYYGYHGCEPETENCPYQGVIGKWKILVDYISEEKSFPKYLLY